MKTGDRVILRVPEDSKWWRYFCGEVRYFGISKTTVDAINGKEVTIVNMSRGEEGSTFSFREIPYSWPSECIIMKRENILSDSLFEV